MQETKPGQQNPSGVTYEKERQVKSESTSSGPIRKGPCKDQCKVSVTYPCPFGTLYCRIPASHSDLKGFVSRTSHDPRETTGLFPDERSSVYEHNIDDLQHLPGYCYPGSILSVFVRYPPIEILHPR